MFLPYFLLTLLGTGQLVASLSDYSRELQSVNVLESNFIQNVWQEKSGLFELYSSLLQEGNLNGNKTLVNNIVVGFLKHELTRLSNFPTLFAKNISKKCHEDSQAYYDANLRLVKWANQMYESTARLPEGLLFSNKNIHANGLFDECINVQAEWINTSFQGQYCTVFFESELVMPDELIDEIDQLKEEAKSKSNWLTMFEVLIWLYNGPALKQPKVRDTDSSTKYLMSTDFCIPSSCTAEDFRSSVAQLIGSRVIGNTTIDGAFYYTSIVSVTDEKHCYTKEKIEATPDFDGPDIAVMTVLSLLVFVTLLANAREFWRFYKNQTVITDKDGLGLKVLHCFSIKTNGQKLLSTKSATVENLACLNGIRVLSTFWIILYHTYFAASVGDYPMYNEFILYQDALTWQVHGITNATVAVDTFLLMSALLVTYSLLRELDRNKGQFNIGLFYLHRYLRLTPVYAVILGFIATLLTYTGSGPYWQNMGYWCTACRWNWWNNLLYINNYVFTYPLACMAETWYLACDMQMFLLSPLFIYLLWKWWKVGLAWATFCIVSSIAGTIAIDIIWDLPPMGLYTRDRDNPHYFYDYYIQIWARCPPYILGIILGWILHRTKKTKIEMSKKCVATGWILTVLVILAVSYGMVPYLDPVKVPEINDVVRVSYASLHRLAWAASVAWISFSCIHGYGGFINRFLSWKMFIPLSRLTYVIYLIHLNYIRSWHAINRKPYYYTKFTHTEHVFGTILMVSLMAFAICLTVEVPFLNLEKLLLPTRTVARKPTPVIDPERG